LICVQGSTASGWLPAGPFLGVVSGSLAIGCEGGVVGMDGRRKDVDEYGALELPGFAKEKVKLDCSGVIVCDVVEEYVDSRTENPFPMLK
jgi:hypothetical protein